MASSTRHPQAFVQNARRARRIPVELPAEVSVSGTRWMAQLADLGPGGCLLVSPRPLLPGTALRLVLRSEAHDPLNVAGQVAWVAPARTGIAFAAQQAADPRLWFDELLRLQPHLAEGRGTAPQELDLEAPLYLQAAPRGPLELGAEERTLLRATENGTPVRELLTRGGLPQQAGHRALFGLFEKKVLTLSLGEASDPWRWRALFPGADAGPLPTIQRARRSAGPTHPAPRVERVQRSDAPGATVADAQLALLRGASLSSRPAAAQQRVEEAERAAAQGRLHEAVTLLRQALSLAPRDPGISRLLGQLAFKDRLGTT